MLCPLPGCPSYPLLRDSPCEAGWQAQRPHASSDHTEATLSIILRFDVSLSCMAGTQWPPAKTTLSPIRQNEVPGAIPPNPSAAQSLRTLGEAVWEGGASASTCGGMQGSRRCIPGWEKVGRRLSTEQAPWCSRKRRAGRGWPGRARVAARALAPLTLDLVVDSASGDGHTPRDSLSESP